MFLLHQAFVSGVRTQSQDPKVLLSGLIGSGLSLIFNAYLGLISWQVLILFQCFFYLFVIVCQHLPHPQAGVFLKDQFNLCCKSAAH